MCPDQSPCPRCPPRHLLSVCVCLSLSIRMSQSLISAPAFAIPSLAHINQRSEGTLWLTRMWTKYSQPQSAAAFPFVHLNTKESRQKTITGSNVAWQLFDQLEREVRGEMLGALLLIFWRCSDKSLTSWLLCLELWLPLSEGLNHFYWIWTSSTTTAFSSTVNYDRVRAENDEISTIN